MSASILKPDKNTPIVNRQPFDGRPGSPATSASISIPDDIVWDDSDSDSDPDPDPGACDKLSSIQTGLLSIESAILNITTPDGDRSRHIYGDIHVNRGHFGNAYCIYHRTSDQAELVSSQRHLTLCGPRHCVQYPRLLYVDLHEREGEGEGGVPFLRTTFPLSPILEQHERCSESFDVSVAGDKGTLVIRFTVIKPSVLSWVQLDLLHINLREEWLVSGTVTAIQTLPGGRTKRTLSLLNRPANEPIDLREVEVINRISPLRTAARTIPLDRKIVVTPLRLEKEYVEALNATILEGGGMIESDPNHLNGQGSFLTIDVALKFRRASQCGDLCCSLEAESKRFELKSSDEVGWVYYDYLEGPITVDACSTLDCGNCRKRPRMANKFLKIQIMLSAFNDLILDKDEEVHETDLPLYVEVDKELRQRKRMAELRPYLEGPDKEDW